MTTKIGPWLAATVISVALAFNAAAADPKRAESYLNDAQKSLQKGDYKAALIQLKNAVQADPENGAARYELGATELRLGDILSAEKELRGALERNFDKDKVAGPLAEVMLRLGKNKELLDEFQPGDRAPDVETSVRIARGYALLSQKNLADAKASFEQALALGGKPAGALLGIARAQAAGGDNAAAKETAQKALDSDPKYLEGWIFLGQLNRTTGDAATARSDFDKAIEISPTNETARLDRVGVLLSAAQLDLAQADVSTVLKANPQNPMANYLQAVIHARQKNYRAAEASLQNMKAALNNFPPALYLLALVNLQQDEIAQAEDNVNRFLQRVPDDEAGTGLLANLLVKRNNLPRAIEVLKHGVDAHPQSLRLLGMLSDAYLRNKQPDDAAVILDRITAAAPDDAALKTSVAAQLLRMGRPEEAITDLESATELAPKSPQAGLLLVLTLLQSNKLDEALKAAQDMRDRLPDDPLAENLLGAITLRKGDPAGAREHFGKALQIKPDFAPAATNLAQLAILERKFPEAHSLLDKVLARDATNLTALLSQADASLGEGNRNDALLWLEKARNGNANALDPRLRLVDAYLSLRDPAKATIVAAELEKLAPQDPRVLNALGEVRLANNDAGGALDSFNRLAELAPNSAPAQLQRARALYAQKDLAGTRAAVEKAIELNPTEGNVEQQFIRLAIETDTVDQELAFLKGLAQGKSDDAIYDALSGDLLMAANKQSDAIAAFSRGLLKREDSAALIVKLAQAQGADNQAKAADLLGDWLKKHPDSPSVRFFYGTTLINLKRYDASITEHETLLKTQPDNVLALNNLAWLYQLKNDPRGLTLAEKAHDLQPNSPEVSDTLAWILVQNGQNARGLDLLEKLAPATPSPDIQYHFAVALKNAGRSQDAKRAVETALSGGKPFDGINEARALLKELSGG